MEIMLLHDLAKQKVINAPKWLPDNTVYLTVMGSEAYGVSSGDSDRDIYGVCIPPRRDVFPHEAGFIHNFGTKPDSFTSYSEHHLKHGKYEYDFTVYSIVKYFDLMMDCNPTMINSLFAPRRCILHSTAISELMRENRHLFLHRGCKAKFSGYAYSQMHKMDNKKHHDNPRRLADIQTNGYDTKYAYHIVRLMLECEQILAEGDLDIERNREILKSIRRGEWTLDQIKKWFADSESNITNLYSQSTIPYGPDQDKIKRLLVECLEMHYGSLDKAIQLDVDVNQLVEDMQLVLDKYKHDI